jgi:hypothetical protein
VSAFGSSMGTAMRSSFGAAILSCGVEEGMLLSYVQVQNMVALREQTEQTCRSLGGVLEGAFSQQQKLESVHFHCSKPHYVLFRFSFRIIQNHKKVRLRSIL